MYTKHKNLDYLYGVICILLHIGGQKCSQSITVERLFVDIDNYALNVYKT